MSCHYSIILFVLTRKRKDLQLTYIQFFTYLMGHCCFLSFCCCNLSISCDMQYLYYIRALSRYNCNKIQFRIKLLLLSKQFCSSVLVGNIKKNAKWDKKKCKKAHHFIAKSPTKYSNCTWKRSESSKSATNRKKCDTKISKLSKVHGQKWTLFARVCHKNKSRNGILLPKLFLPSVRKIALVIKKKIWNSRLKAENLQNFWYH